MRRCTVLRTSSFSAAGFGAQPRRWVSYDKAELTKEALLRRIESGLGEDADGKPMTVDPESKTIATAAGSLPISPLFDPAWMKARRRQKKDDKGPPSGRFRKKLASNPYARALSTPLRRCPTSDLLLPRYFLQDFELVKHPTNGQDFWAPGPLSFGLNEPKKEGLKEKATDEIKDADDLEALEGRDTAATAAGDTNAAATQSQKSDPVNRENESVQEWRPRRAPVTVYTACRKSVLEEMDRTLHRSAGRILGSRHGMAVKPQMRSASWPEGMSKTLLQAYRGNVVDALIRRSTKTGESKYKYVQPCDSWDAVKGVMRRGCVLWLPAEKDAADTQYATLDVKGVQYGGKMAVHNLYWLLGKDEVARLRAAAEVFRDSEVLVLTQRPSVMGLHMLLWRLQGYLADAEA